MKITSKGQVTIPQELREEFGFLPNTEIDFVKARSSLRLVKPKQRSQRGKKLIEWMKGRGKGKLSTDEIMRMTRGEK